MIMPTSDTGNPDPTVRHADIVPGTTPAARRHHRWLLPVWGLLVANLAWALFAFWGIRYFSDNSCIEGYATAEYCEVAGPAAVLWVLWQPVALILVLVGARRLSSRGSGDGRLAFLTRRAAFGWYAVIWLATVLTFFSWMNSR